MPSLAVLVFSLFKINNRRISGCRSAKLLASPNAVVSLEIPDVE